MSTVRGVAAAYDLALLVLLFTIISVVKTTVRVTSDSMVPTICSGDVVLVEPIQITRAVAWLRRGGDRIRRNDIIVFRRIDPKHPNEMPELYVKRVVAIGSDKARIFKGTLIVNDVVVVEPYVRHIWTHDGPLDSWPRDPNGDGIRPVTIMNSHYLVMGDNRDDSDDSRRFGPVNNGDIIGTVMIIVHAGGTAGCGASPAPKAKRAA